MFEPAIECFRGAVAGAGPVEVREHVPCAAFQRPAQRNDLGQRSGNAGTDRADHCPHELFASGAVRFAVRGDDALVDTPGRFDFGVVVRNEQGLQPVFLLLGEQIVPGVQGPAGCVERIPGPSSVTNGLLLDTLAAPVQGIAGKPDDVKRVMPTSA